METKQTAVDWLIEELGEYFPHEIGGIHLMVEQAKQMEKEQIKDAFTDGCIGELYELNAYYTSEKYYNQTYGPQVDKE
jgi:hypothetical protein